MGGWRGGAVGVDVGLGVRARLCGGRTDTALCMCTDVVVSVCVYVHTHTHTR